MSVVMTLPSTSSASPAVLELARIAAMRCGAAQIQDQITARIHQLADDPVPELNQLALFAGNTTSALAIRKQCRLRIRTLKGLS